MSTHYLEQKSGKIAYDDTGSGPLIICVPGMGDLRAEYRFLSPQIASAGYRVISMDIRGHGETSALWPDYSVGAIGSDLIALIRSLDAGAAIIIGTSMAAGAAVWAAAEAPELITGLVLVSPVVRGKTPWYMKLLCSVLFARPWGPSMWLRYYSTLYPSNKPGDFNQYGDVLRANLKEPGRIEALLRMMTASQADTEDRLPRVTVPSLVIMGSKDPDFKDPEAEAQWVAKSLRGTYQMVKDAGHYPHAEMPDVTGQLVLSFLQSLKELKKI